MHQSTASCFFTIYSYHSNCTRCSTRLPSPSATSHLLCLAYNHIPHTLDNNTLLSIAHHFNKEPFLMPTFIRRENCNKTVKFIATYFSFTYCYYYCLHCCAFFLTQQKWKKVVLSSKFNQRKIKKNTHKTVMPT